MYQAEADKSKEALMQEKLSETKDGWVGAKKWVLVGLIVLVATTMAVWNSSASRSRQPALGDNETNFEEREQAQFLMRKEVATDNNGWVLMVRSVSGNWFPTSSFTTGLLNENDPTNPAYCALARLENYRVNGKFHFKLRWPSLNNREQEWKQSLNPFTDRSAPTGQSVAGYETGINSPPINFYWRGLFYDGVGYSFLTSRTPWYSVGSFRVFGQNVAMGIGGPVDGRHGKLVSQVELYVYGGAPTTTSPPITTTQPPLPPSEPCFPCGVMGKDLCDVSKKCAFNANYCRCRNLQTDFVFLMDASGSVGSQGFDFEKQVVDTMLLNLPADSRVGVIQFGDTAMAVSKLFSGQSITQVRASVMSISHAGGATHMGEAIQMSLGADYFGNPQETRTRLRMVILTDGVSNGPVNPCDLAAQIQSKAGLEVIVIGVTNGFSAPDVTCLVSDPVQYIIEVQSLTLNSFAAVWNRIDNLICPDPALIG